MTEAIYVALMGDPTLRMEPVAPPSSLGATPNNGNIVLNWSPSTDPVVGYHVYRSTSPMGPFTRLTSSLVSGTTFTDFGPAPNTYTYMVRAVQLQNNFSGSYYDPSQGIFAAVQTSTTSITLTARSAGNGLALTWTSQSGVLYHVQYKDTLTQTSWTDLPGSSYTASGAITTWVDSSFSANRQRFYRISSP